MVHRLFTRRLDRLDLAVGAAIVGLALAISVTIAIGDRAGVGATILLPAGKVHTTTPVRIVFDEPMDTASVEVHFAIEPPTTGKFSWNGAQLTFTPSAALTADQTYEVTIRAGASSTRGRLVTNDVRWTFQVRRPRIVYLSPAVHERGSDVPNLWIVDSAPPYDARQLTFSQYEVIDFSPSPDGTQIAYAQESQDGSADLYLLNVDSGETRRVTQCAKALCQSPDWSPDGSRLVFERIELNRDLPQLDRGMARAWVVNLKDLSASPLLADPHALGKMPRWSPDGTQIAVYDQNLHAIAVYDLAGGTPKSIPTFVEETGTFEPTGTRYVFANLVQGTQGYFNVFSIADLAHPQGGIRSLNGRDLSPVADHQSAWSRDGKRLAVTRRYLDKPNTCDPQIYLVNPDSGEGQPLVVEGRYLHGAVSWNPAGDQLAFQRYPCTEPEAQPDIWLFDIASNTSQRIGRNGYMPRWMP
jgi:Tol biopolymer transport system component